MKGWDASHIERLRNRGMVSAAPGKSIVPKTFPENPKKYSQKTLKNIPTQSEDSMQRQCFTWFRFQYPDYHHRIFHIPNGGHRMKQTVVNKKTGKVSTYSPIAKKLKDMGALAGVWDIFLSVPRFGFSGFFIEMKAGKNTLTDNQLEFREANDRDYLFKVCYSLEEFKIEIDKYLK